MRITMLLSFAAALLASALPMPINAAQLTESDYEIFVTLYPNADRKVFDLSWSKRPTLKDIEASIPKDATSAGRTEWWCSIASDGSLQTCQLAAEWPENQGFGDAARKLLPKFRLTHEVVVASARTDAKAVLQINLEDDRRRVTDIPGNCPPPFCSAVVPPPPLRAESTPSPR